MAYTGITGTVQGASPNFDPGVICGANLDLSGVLPAGQVGNCYSADGELWIGSTSATAGGTHSKIGKITSGDGSVDVINGSGSIDLRVATQQFAPNAVLQEFDDFISSSSTGDETASKLCWYSGSNGLNQVDGTQNNPGIWCINSFGNPDAILYMGIKDSIGTFISGCLALGGGVLTSTFVINLVALSSGLNTYRFSCGLADSLSISTPTDSFQDGIYFQYTDGVNSGNWQIKSTKAGVTTTHNTSIAAVTGFVSLSVVVNAAGTSVRYLINNTEVAVSPLTTNIPTAALVPFIYSKNLTGLSPNHEVDLYYVTNVLTTPRPGPNPSSGAVVISSGNLVLIQSQTAVNQPTVNFTTGISGYDLYIMNFYGVTMDTAGSNLGILYSTDGGATWDNSAVYDWNGYYDLVSGVGSQGSTGQPYSFIANGNGTAAGNLPISGDIKFYNLGSNVFYKQSIANTVGYFQGGSEFINGQLGNTYENTAIVNGIQIFMSAGGNLLTGTFKLYGVVN